jgi:sortase (surface protein transpeptidase)
MGLRSPALRDAGPAPTPRSSAPSSVLPLVASLVLIALFAGALGLGQMFGLPMPWNFHWSRDPALHHSVPTAISIPTLGVRAPVVSVGTASDGSIATPTIDKPDQTGWYRLGPTPGERGTAIIVGHVDSAQGPAVFARLVTLSPGKTVDVIREDRRTATFQVESVQRAPKTAFPADKVFAGGNAARLVLVTCGGAWVGGDVGYADNVIVYATLT